MTAANIRTASSPSRNTIMLELNTIVAWLWKCLTSVGSTGPVLAVAMR